MDPNESQNQSLKGVVGIQNIGNTCYCNSTLQLIRACPHWSAFCLTQNFSEYKDSKYKRVLVAYQDILRSLWSSYKPAYVRPLGFISEIRNSVKDTVYEMFGILIPNDSHEFLVYLLDSFHEAIKTESPYIENTSNTMSAMSENGWNKFLSKNNSEIVNMFFGMIRKTIHCTTCKNNTYQWEVFNSLKIPCDGQTFKEWIQNEMKESEIEGYNCENCSKTSGCKLAKIYSHIWRLPYNLFITLHRFNSNGTKNMIKCPYEGENINFSEYFAEESDDPSREWMYEVRGVSDHHGSHMGGHYTTQFKHPISEEWWMLDDATATKQHPHFSESNYIFLFIKI